MIFRRSLPSLVPLLSVALMGCVEGGVHHGAMMRGQILDLDNGAATISVGAQDGVKPGQIFDVQHYTHVLGDSSQNRASNYSRSVVGKVQIIEVIDAHYARAQIASGKPSVNDVVELEVP